MVQGIKYPSSYYDSEDDRIIIEADEELQKAATEKMNDYAKNMDEHYQSGFYDGYILGAYVQKLFMFHKAWGIFKKYATFEHPRKGTTECVMTKSQFRKAMGMEE